MSLSIEKRRVEEWRQRLIDLSRRNRLLYYRPTKSSSLKITGPDCESVFDRLIRQEKSWKFWIPPLEDEKQKDNEEQKKLKSMPKADDLVCKGVSRKELEKILKNIYRRSIADYRERGVRILYLVLGTLQWKEVETSETVVSPLLMCPVELARETASDPYTLTLVDEDVILNPALQVKLRKDFNIDLPSLPDDWDQVSFDKYLKQIQMTVKSLNWSTDLSVLLGLFSFHKIVMYQDLLDNISLIENHPVVKKLCGNGDDNNGEDVPDEKQLDTCQKTIDTFQIMDADSSQQRCIQAALRGHSIVLQGPPGTGKSQTIANIISEFVARGKNVLFVSEKMAALEVVFKRLNDAGLGDLCFELHSHKANKREVIMELKRCLDEILVPQQLPSESEYEDIERLRSQLNDYVQALHEIREPLHETAYTVLAKLSQLNSVPFAQFEIKHIEQLRQNSIKEASELINRLAFVWHVVEEGESFPWTGCKDTKYNINIKEEWTTYLKSISEQVNKIDSSAKEFADMLGVDQPKKIGDFEWLIEVGRHLEQSPGPHRGWFTSFDIGGLLKEAQDYTLLNDDFWKLHKQLSEKYTDELFNLPYDFPQRVNFLYRETKRLLLLEDNKVITSEDIHNILRIFQDSSEQLENCLLNATGTAKNFGFSTSEPTVSKLRELGQLAVMCGLPSKPDQHWFSEEKVKELKSLINRMRPLYKEYNDIRSQLLNKYDESFFTLDHNVLIETFNGFLCKSFLRVVNPHFYQIKKTILHTCRGTTLPESLQDDLLKARDYMRLKKQIDTQSSQLQAALGSYYENYDTDFILVEQALSVAEKILNLITVRPIPNNLIKYLSNGTPSFNDLVQTGQSILTCLDIWEQKVEKYQSFLPCERLPLTRQPINISSVKDIITWLKETAIPLNQLHDLIENVLPFYRDGKTISLFELIADLKTYEDMGKLQKRIDEESDRLHQEFGDYYCGVDTNWNNVIASLVWTQNSLKLFADKTLPEQFVTIAVEKRGAELQTSHLADILKESKYTFQEFESKFEVNPNSQIVTASLKSRVNSLLERVSELQDWIDFKKICNEFQQSNFNDFLTWALRERPESNQLNDIFQKAVLQTWVNFVFESDNRLSDFRGHQHEQVISAFRGLDKKLVQLSTQRIIELYNSRRPVTGFFQAQDSEVAVLKREAAKRKRHLPVRHLFSRIPNLLLRLKPCMMMSPLSVSQFINPEIIKFGLVIFDEASQIFTEDAIGSIYRGDQIVVAGDTKQLPPTNFFNALDNDEEDESEEDEVEELVSADYQSVLDECNTILPPIPLTWHYRSRHESLIAFSNHVYYEKKLITFPSATHSHDLLGIKFEHVHDGIYDRGGKRNNIKEAKAVANFVIEHFQQQPKMSLGVIAFSQAQMTAIEDEIELIRQQNPEYEHFFKEDRLEGFFVKNLENVQGDERDVIVFSIGYGKDHNGRMTMAFGPLNKLGGERRLNVAVTRARFKVVIVSSIKAGDFDLKATSKAGVLNLHRYLDYAERGEVALELQHPQGLGGTESPLEDDVANVIRQMGYDVVTQVGCSGYRIDLGVVDPAEPGRFILGVECDGATYHSAATARDRDRLRQQVLEQLGWTIHRIWSPDWAARRDIEIERLRQKIEETRGKNLQFKEIDGERKEKKTAKREQLFKTVIAEEEDIDAFNPIPGTTNYDVYEVQAASIWETDFYLPQYMEHHRNEILNLINTEGPIHIEVVTRRIAKAWGMSRAGNRIKGVIEKAINNLERRKLLSQYGDFLWPSEMELAPVRVPYFGEAEATRTIEHIAPEELQAGMYLVVQHNLGIGIESLIKETARLFGFARTGDTICNLLKMQLEKLVHDGFITVNGEKVSVIG